VQVERSFVHPTGELPVSLSCPIANPTTRQMSFLTLMNSKANRLWDRDPPVYCNLLSSCDRTSEQESRCRVVGFAIGPDRRTGSSPLHDIWPATSPCSPYMSCSRQSFMALTSSASSLATQPSLVSRQRNRSIGLPLLPVRFTGAWCSLRRGNSVCFCFL
jgi:hypothetical protein